MGRNTIPTPEKYCEYCGKQLTRKRRPNGYLEPIYFFQQRKYCDLTCSGKASSVKRLSKYAINSKTSRQRARKIKEKCACEICGKEGYTEVHHKDNNPLNNDISNLIRLCKSCHKKQHVQKGICIVCGLPQKGHGLCQKHWQVWRRSIITGRDTEYSLRIKQCLNQ